MNLNNLILPILLYNEVRISSSINWQVLADHIKNIGISSLADLTSGDAFHAEMWECFNGLAFKGAVRQEYEIDKLCIQKYIPVLVGMGKQFNWSLPLNESLI